MVYAPKKNDKITKLEYLLRTRKGYWNDDYAKFLISQVWKIDKPISVLDCGCGYGFLGLLLLPYLPTGSTYTGIDFAEDLIKEGKNLFKQQKQEATFLCKNVFDHSAENQYDLVICQAVLRHLDNPAAFIQKMITFARHDGYVVCIDANREFECCGLYIDGMDYQELCRHDGLEKKWRTELTMQGRDYAVAIRTAHMIQKLGLIDVDVRMNDKVEFVTTQSVNKTWYLLLEMDYIDGVPISDMHENSEALFCEISEALMRSDCTEMTKVSLRKILDNSANYFHSDIEYKAHKGNDYTLYI